MAQLRADVRALLAGLPSREQALQQQRRNLVQFVADNRDAFDAMPYEPWTREPASPTGAEGLKFEVRASSNVPGLRGVFPRQPVRASSKVRRLLYYPGLLTTDKLYQSFHDQYYCPTGLGLPPLAYKEGGKTVDIVIIGDPTSLGALINDGKYQRDDGQCSDCKRMRRCCLRCCSRCLLSVCLLHPCRRGCQLRAQVVLQGARVTGDDRSSVRKAARVC